MRDELAERIDRVDEEDFGELALDVFRYQSTHNPIYAEYLRLLRIDPASVTRTAEIPALPISLFKRHQLMTGNWHPAITFTSSGTTGATTSRHLLRDPEAYRRNAARAFEQRYGPLAGRPVLALLPAYLERGGSSLVFMADHFIKRSGHPASGFYLNELDELSGLLSDLRSQDLPYPPLLLGVTFALLDLAEAHPQPLDHCIVMETGGMKGRRKELTRQELHARLKEAFSLSSIHGEYGMTELLSQAYAPDSGLYYPGPTLYPRPRQLTDPLARETHGRACALDLIDLANLDTISFIATEDLGRVYADGSFEVLGRMDYTDVRGCSQLVS